MNHELVQVITYFLYFCRIVNIFYWNVCFKIIILKIQQKFVRFLAYACCICVNLCCEVYCQ